ncbi:reverse transcriptase domain-containing protein [Halopseudomonas sp. SMJS2]|uniref:reverse transcriptase domain-containing protein n=1 Tax=Halopseudomonas sp. SMJS2 TaxID=3041098 RepID=UPI0024535C0A|nr:reverse transcriptase domain-containing protein [Halopseudomonas sp. SMJS2]WGK60488.1 reverse transcriptase domain-containing protein [Halopseudomonas sp. SMJS2]
MERWIYKFEIKPGRWVFVPSEPERLYGETLLTRLKTLWKPPPFFYHLQPGGHLAAINSHMEHAYFCCLDIEDYFGSINRSRLIRTLKARMGYPKAVESASRSLVRLQRNGEPYYCLPFGFVQSAYLASMCLYESKLGRVLAEISEMEEVKLSVYMDDIVVSSDDFVLLENCMQEILRASIRSRFPINQAKTQPPATFVTVFNIILSKGSLRITQGRMQEFRAAFRESKSPAQEKGILDYVRIINSAQVSGVIN